MNDRQRFVSDAIFVDEIGIEIGVYGDYRLQSLYQPIFSPRAGNLVPIAIEGLIQPVLWGEPIAPGAFFAAIPPEDALFVESMCRALHLRNYHNVGVDRLELFFNYDPRANGDLKKSLTEIAFMSRRLRDICLDPALLICEITEAAALDEGVLVQLVAAMRSQGIRIAVDDFGLGHSTPERVSRLSPDIVKIDGGLIRRIARESASARLLAPAVRGLHAGGATVLAEGIETSDQLRVALDAGIDMFQGFLLGRPALAGTIFDDKPKPLADLLEPPRKIVPLFG